MGSRRKGNNVHTVLHLTNYGSFSEELRQEVGIFTADISKGSGDQGASKEVVLINFPE